MDKDLKSIVYSRDVIEFVTVSLEYCAYLENFNEETTQSITDKLSKLLPLLYLKASLLPETEMVDEFDTEISVTEDDYNYMLSKLAEVYGKDDTFLEVFLEDMKYSETPIIASVSEDLTDIYQDLKNFITIYERGLTENMNDALYVCTENFKTYWGQKLVNVLRALHSLKYGIENDNLDEDADLTNTDEAW